MDPQLVNMLAQPSPESIPLWAYYLMSMAGLALLGANISVVAFVAKRVIDRLDKINTSIYAIREQAVKTETRLDDHIHDDGRHCKGNNCPAMQRMVR